MKILRITLRNLASLAGTHTVDFTREPLLSAGLFAISGPMGSGKSTLLDALCLALYEQTPRLTAASGVKLPDAGGEITQRDPANLLRRGAAEGFAEVAFVGVDRLDYTARWSIRRARNRVDGAFQQTEMSLHQGNVSPCTPGIPVQTGKKSEVLPAIAEKVGLTYAQFTRAVLLAQNDFAVFLKADDRERATILQALTGTERFERLSVAIFARNKAEDDAVRALEIKLTGRVPMNSDSRAVAEKERDDANAALAAIDAKLAERELHLSWFRRLHELNTAIENATATLTNAQRLLNESEPRRQHLDRVAHASAEARPLRDALTRETRQLNLAIQARNTARDKKELAAQELEKQRQRHRAAGHALTLAKQALEAAAPSLERARTLDTLIEPLTARLASARKECDAAEKAVRGATERHDALRKRIENAEAECLKLKNSRTQFAIYEPVVADAQTWVERLRAAAQARAAREDAQRELKLKQTALADLKSQLERAKDAHQKQLAARELTVATLHKAEAASKEFDTDALLAERRRLDSAHATWTSLRTHFHQLAETTSSVSTLQQEIGALTLQVTKDAEALNTLQTTRLPDAQTAFQTAKEILAAAEAAVGDQAALLRETLTADQPCPVCGSVEHPFSSHPPIEDVALRSLRQSHLEKQKSLEALREEGARLDTTLGHTRKLIETKRTALTGFDDKIATLHRQLNTIPEAVELLALPDAERLTTLDARIAATTANRVTLEARETARNQAVNAINAARLADEESRVTVTKAERALAEINNRAAATEAAHEAAHSQDIRAAETHAATTALLAPLFAAIPTTSDAFTTDAAAFIEAFTRDTNALRSADQHLLEARQQTEKDAVQLDALRNEVTTLTAALDKLRTTEADLRRDHDTKQNERKALLDGRPVADVERALKSAEANALKAADDASAALNEADKSAAAADEALRKDEAAIVSSTTLRDAARTALDAWLHRSDDGNGHPLNDTALDALLQRDEAWIKAERAALDALGGAVRIAEGARQAHELSLTAHAGTRPTTDTEAAVQEDLAQRRSEKEAAVQRQLDAATVLNADDSCRAENAALIEQINTQRAKAGPWSKLNDMLGSSDGAKFRAIAQRRTLDLLLGFANAQLDLLSARYRLERLPESLNLIVMDRDMADERRSVHSLSGGESFLVSLALALGLASLSSNRLRIESLFIDEGFGSLDPATLNIAMNALMHLEAQGRRVGVISHVSEMADAIPVQIRVVKGRSGASRLEVPGAAPTEPATEPLTASAARVITSARAAAAAITVHTLSPEALTTYQETLLTHLRANGGKAGNITLQSTLGWDAPTYEAVKNALLASGSLKSGRGRGGSVMLNSEPSPE